jgi:archaellum biogenesis ATPase FlaH
MSFYDDIKLIGFKPTIQTFNDSSNSNSKARILSWGAQYQDLIQEGAGIYWCVNPQEKSNQRGIENTESWCCVGLDVDVAKEGSKTSIEEILATKEAMTILLMSLDQPPTGILESKNGLHPYWFFQPIPLPKISDRKEANEVYKAIIKGIKMTENISSEGDSISRVLRLEGTLHQKNPSDKFKVVYRGGTGKLIDFPKFKSKYFVSLSPQLYESKHINSDSIYDADVVEGLRLLSGNSLVRGEIFEFEEVKSGKRQIIIDGKRSGQWIDIAKNAIGGHPGGEGSYNLVRWVKYYNPDMLDNKIRKELDTVVLGKDNSIPPVKVVPVQEVSTINKAFSGFKYIDSALGGFRVPGTYVLGGYEKSGKSTLLLCFASNMIKSGLKVGYLDTETTRADVINILAIQNTDMSMDEIEKDQSIARQWEENWGDKLMYAGTPDLSDEKDQLSFEVTANKAREFINQGAQVLIFDNLTTFSITTAENGWTILSKALQTCVTMSKKYNILCFPVIHTKSDQNFTTSPDGIRRILKGSEPLKIFEESLTVILKPTGKDLYGGGAARSQISGTILVWRPYQMVNNDQLNSQGMLLFESFSKVQPKSNVRFSFEGQKKKFSEIGFQEFQIDDV